MIKFCLENFPEDFRDETMENKIMALVTTLPTNV